ncbi:MAG TPA: biotin/lipoyl-binding protein, partial [Cellvibrio sp.]
MKRPALVKSIVIIFTVLLIGGAVWLFSGDKDKDAKSALNTATVSRGNIEAVVTAQGKLEPKEYVDVGAEVSGQIKKLHVDYGSVVKQGDLIAEIDPASYEAAVKGDEARIKQLEAQLLQQDAAI